MLVLSRMTNEEICIGDDIRVLVVEMGGGKVKLGIDAPRDIEVHRSEVYERIKRQGEPSRRRDKPERFARRVEVREEKPTPGPEAITAPLPESEMLARYDRWRSECNWSQVPSFEWWMWASTENRTPDGGMLRSSDDEFLPFSNWMKLQET